MQKEQEINQELELLVLASDGLWDVVPNEDAVSIAWGEEEAEAAARKLTETAFTRGNADNITCIVVKFHHDKAESVDPQLEHKKQADFQHESSQESEISKDQESEISEDQECEFSETVAKNRTSDTKPKTKPDKSRAQKLRPDVI